VSNEMLCALANNDGVIGINCGRESSIRAAHGKDAIRSMLRSMKCQSSVVEKCGDRTGYKLREQKRRKYLRKRHQAVIQRSREWLPNRSLPSKQPVLNRPLSVPAETLM
jgi:hypothetical protein